MKVLLQNPDASDGRHIDSLTVGCEYEVLGIEADMYRLLDDRGVPLLFDAECFRITQQDEPSFWKSFIGDEGERYVYPPGWGVPGFFESWHDGVEMVRELFAEQLDHWYPMQSRPVGTRE